MSLLTTLPNVDEPTNPAERVRVSRLGTNHVLYSPDGRFVATSDVRMNVVVRRGDDVIYEKNFESDNPKIRSSERVRSLSFSPDGQNLWIAAGEKLRVVDVASGKIWWEYTPDRSFGFLVSSPLAVAAGEREIVASFDNGVMAFGTMKGEGELDFRPWRDQDAPKFLAFPNGQQILGVDHFSIARWDLTGSKVSRIGVEEKIYGAAFHPKAPLIATRHLRTLSLWNVEAESVVYSTPVQIGLPLVEFHPTLPLLALGSQQSVQVVTVEGVPVADFHSGEASVISFGFSPDGRELSVGCSDQILRRFTVPV